MFITDETDRVNAQNTLSAKVTHLAMDLYSLPRNIGYDDREDAFMIATTEDRDNYTKDAQDILYTYPHLLNLAEREVMFGPGGNL